MLIIQLASKNEYYIFGGSIMKMSKDPDYLYHYTTIKGCEGILKSGTLRATHFMCANDTKEFTYGGRFIEAWVNKNYVNERGLAEQHIRNEIKLLKGLVEYNEPKKSTERSFYITCFSVHNGDKYEEDNGLLSMWRGYGNGVAIVFKRKDLINTIVGLSENGRVSYQEDREKIEEIDTSSLSKAPDLSKYFEIIRVFFEEGSELKKENLNCKVHLEKFNQHLDENPEISNAVLRLYFLIKHIGFREEKEYRFAFCRREKERYIEPFGDIIHCVDKIIIGPSEGQKNIKHEMKNFISKDACINKIPVECSKTPYHDKKEVPHQWYWGMIIAKILQLRIIPK